MSAREGGRPAEGRPLPRRLPAGDGGAAARARDRQLKSATPIAVEVDDLNAVDWGEHTNPGDFVIAHG